MTDATAGSISVEALAEEFLERKRRGEQLLESQIEKLSSGCTHRQRSESIQKEPRHYPGDSRRNIRTPAQYRTAPLQTKSARDGGLVC